MAVDIKQLTRGILEEAFCKGRLEVVDQACDASYTSYDPLLGKLDLAGFKRSIEGYRASFADMQVTILGACAEGDTVCTLWRMSGTHRAPFLGFAATGKRASVEGISYDRVRGGKLVESHQQWDTLSFLQQLGAMPSVQALKAEKPAAEVRPHA